MRGTVFATKSKIEHEIIGNSEGVVGMYKNKELKETLQSLSQTAYSLYEKELQTDNSIHDETLRINIALNKLAPRIKEIPEFQICIDLMARDEKIKTLQGKLVGTYTSMSIVESEEVCVLSFLNQMYYKSKKYDQDLFNKRYLSFEEFFYSNDLIFKDSANLYNFSFNKDEIALGHEITIRLEKGQTKPQDEYTEFKHRPHTVFSKSTYVLERDYKTKKIVDETDKKETEISKELSETSNLFDLVIDSLRILKSSAVYRDYRISSESITFHPFGAKLIRFSAFESVVMGEKCNIEEVDIVMLCKIFDFLCRENDSRFKVAQRRLSLGIERKNPEDRLIDYMIGLEALYLPDGNAELSFRLSIRVAFLLFAGDDKKEAFNFLRKMYGVRSSIVHGNKYSLSLEDIEKLEEMLRKSVILWIEDKNYFSVTEKTKSGKLKNEGNLDIMLFDD